MRIKAHYPPKCPNIIIFFKVPIILKEPCHFCGSVNELCTFVCSSDDQETKKILMWFQVSPGYVFVKSNLFFQDDTVKGKKKKKMHTGS